MEIDLKKILAMLIIGDEGNQQFDGKFKCKRNNDGYRYHIDAIADLIKDYRQAGYNIDDVNLKNTSEEAGFNIISKGHILLCNCSINDNNLIYIFVPSKITNYQLATLKLFEPQLQQLQNTYIMKIDEMGKETFNSISFSNNFSFDNLINSNSRTK